MTYPTTKELLERIQEKLDKHDKSLFTALELNALKNVVKMRLDQLEAFEIFPSNS